MLSRYRFLKRLGTGAAGSVYLVEDRSLGGEMLALKRVEHAADPAVRESFLREFAVLSSLSLPGLARVRDLGVIPSGGSDLGIAPGPFFTREYVAGAPLDEWQRGRDLDVLKRVLLVLFRTVARLHARGVIHGDLKPTNVIVDAKASPWLIDFGLASNASRAPTAGGTLAFMAPELFSGASSSMAADVYALGATIWTLVTGGVPLGEHGPNALRAKLQGTLPSFPAELDAAQRSLLEAALWALAPDQRARCPSVDELSARIEHASPRAPAVAATDAWVVPQTRGRGPVFATLVRRARESAIVRDPLVLHGPAGIGKSTVLRELKWRLQLTGAQVLEVHCRGAAFPALVQLAHQIDVQAADGEASDAPATSATEAERARVVARTARALMAPGDQPYVLLVDDLDEAESPFAEAVRAALHGEAGRPPIVIATSRSVTARRVAEFVGAEQLELTALPEREQREIVAELLVGSDDTTAALLCVHAAGNPGRLLDALSWLARRGEVVARDLSQLPHGETEDGLAARRAALLDPPARTLLCALAIARAPLPAELSARAFDDDAVVQLLQHGVARSEAGMLVASEQELAEWLRRTVASDEAAQLAARMLAQPGAERLDPVAQVELALAADDRARLMAQLPSAIDALVARGASAQALRLCDAGLARALHERRLLLSASELALELGECARAGEYAERALAMPSASAPSDTESDARLRIAAASAHIAGTRYERAVALLSAIDTEVPGRLQVHAARELARARLRLGELDAARAAVDRGLAVSIGEVPGRAELLAIDGHLRSQQGHYAEADRCFEAAVQAARALAAPREEALVLGYAAISQESRGALSRARETFEQGLALARRSGDLGLAATYALNLGNVSYRAGHLEGVEQQYVLSRRLARYLGRDASALTADCNLARLHVYLGSFTRARVLAEGALAEAERLGLELSQAQAYDYLGEIEARSGQANLALAYWEKSGAVYARFGRQHAMAELLLDAAELLLDRGTPDDVDAAAEKLQHVRTLVETHAQDDVRPRLALVTARERAARGDVAGAVKDLAELVRTLDAERDIELTWQVLAAEATLHIRMGASLLGTRKAREAAELIEALAARVPIEARESFLADARRRAVMELARDHSDLLLASAPKLELTRRESLPRMTPSIMQLLKLMKGLLLERDLDRLLERIADAAVDLSGAERGFVLLVDAQGQLAPHTMRASGTTLSDPYLAFSHSIAEAVLIDGEPIITTDARVDRRFREFMSVHVLMLKSVICLPISGPTGVLGVLYLEHRLKAGQFHDDDIELLVAFASQAARALENARLWAENEQRKRELEAQAEALAEAKAEIERVLAARTEELEQVRSELGAVREKLMRGAIKNGIVGQSRAIRHVGALIDRVVDSTVPVVIVGETGTGKELVARAIHANGARKRGPFVTVNCGALPDELLESELFGHVRGAFTGAIREKRGLFVEAQGGTLLLDEFADISPRMQIALLRVVQERAIRQLGADHDTPIDARLIATSSRPLKELVAAGRLREDLFYRLNVVEIRLPALRERTEDIPLLCEHILERAALQSEGGPRKLSRAALTRLVSHPLPGNVRQLENILTRAVTVADGVLIELEDLALEGIERPRAHEDEDEPIDDLVAPRPSTPSSSPPDSELTFKLREKERMVSALEKFGWNRSKAAAALGMPRRTFYRRLHEFGLV